MYTYEHELLIQAPIEKVFDTHFDYHNYDKWQPNLLDVKLISGQYLEPHHLIHLIYENHIIMEESLELYNRPYHAVFTYRLGKTFNRQILIFKSKSDHTLLKVKTEFYFDHIPPASEDVFKAKTLQSLNILKSYIESKK